jgi:sulfatase maturation enzyme AslB (radical SAM superfamily)
LSNNSNWCPEVYRSLFIDKHNNDHVRIAPCCQAESDTEPADTFDFVSSPYLNQYRQLFDRNERAPGCHRCWQAEDVGLRSRRQSAIEFYNMSVDRTVLLEGIDHSATWACNLACIMCSPFSSSTWAAELSMTKQELHRIGRSFPKYNSYLTQLDLTNVKKLHFNGGEPLRNNEHMELMNKLQQQGDFGNVLLSYNTNGTTMPSERTIDMWSQARAVRIYFSIDATDAAFEYIRYPAKWSQVADNMIRMREELPSNVMFGINVTVGCYNVFETADVLQWFNTNLATNREGDASDFTWQSSEGYYIKYLSERAIIAVTEYINAVPELSSLATYIQSEREASDEWTIKLDQIDRRRGTDWRQTLKIGQYY